MEIPIGYVNLTKTVHAVSVYLNMTDLKKNEFQKATLSDPLLCKSNFYQQNEWLKNKTKVDKAVKFYYNLRNQLHVEEDLLFINFRLIIPLSMQAYVLGILHETHFGMTKTKQRARQILYSPGMTNRY